MEKILKFPSCFLWGTATSSYQVEGDIKNADWSDFFPARKACNHYFLFEKDFELMKNLNLNAYRFSIEWSRIEKKEGEFDQKEIEHYRQFLKTLKEKNIKTILTLHHFTNPQWLYKYGGWANKKIIFYFSRFAQKMFQEYNELVDFWITINEPLIFAAFGYLTGRWPPRKKNLLLFFQAIKNQTLVHKKIFKEFKKLNPNSKIGLAQNTAYFEPFNKKSFLDNLNAKFNHFCWNQLFIELIKKNLSFIGINYYSSQTVKFPWQDKTIKKEVSDIGWPLFPSGLYWIVKQFQKFNLPILITENGIADEKDILRKKFIKEHLFWLHKAISEGVKVLGYLHWSFMDNLEWDFGFKVKFGLVEIDFKTQERKPRNSAFYFSKIAKENALILNDEDF